MVRKMLTVHMHLARRWLISIPLVLLLAAAVHLDWHAARPVHTRLALGWPYHWLLAVPLFAGAAVYVGKKWPRRSWTASAVNIMLALALGQPIVLLGEMLMNRLPISHALDGSRWTAFAEFTVAGFMTYLLVMGIFLKRRQTGARRDGGGRRFSVMQPFPNLPYRTCCRHPSITETCSASRSMVIGSHRQSLRLYHATTLKYSSIVAINPRSEQAVRTEDMTCTSASTVWRRWPQNCARKAPTSWRVLSAVCTSSANSWSEIAMGWSWRLEKTLPVRGITSKRTRLRAGKVPRRQAARHTTMEPV